MIKFAMAVLMFTFIGCAVDPGLEDTARRSSPGLIAECDPSEEDCYSDPGSGGSSGGGGGNTPYVCSFTTTCQSNGDCTYACGPLAVCRFAVPQGENLCFNQ